MMAQKKFAFLLMGTQYQPSLHRAHFETPGMDTYILTVQSFEQALAAVRELADIGVGALELSGAFGQAQARRLMEEARGQMAVGYVVPLPGQEERIETFFS